MRRPAVALAAARSPSLLVTAEGAVVRTLDSGATAREVLASAKPTWALAQTPGLLCATSGEQTRRSTDTGLTWFAASSGSSTLGAVGGKLFLVRGTSLGQLARVINREAPSSAVYFQTDQARPAATMRPFLLRLGRALAENPRRALRVERHVDQRGAGARRRSRPSASAIGFGFGFGFGSRRPVRAGTSEEALARNRRVELLLLEPLTEENAARCPSETTPEDDSEFSE